MGWFKKRDRWQVGKLNGNGWYWVWPDPTFWPFIAHYRFVDGKPTLMIQDEYIPNTPIPQTMWKFCGPLKEPKL